MSRFADSPIANLLRVLGDLILLNLLWLFCSAPIITLGASTSAMYAVLIRQNRGETVPVVRTFFKYFAKNFPSASIIWLVVAIMGVLAYANGSFAMTFEGFIKSTFLVVATIWGFMSFVVFTLGITQQSIYENNVINYIFNSLKLAACAPGWLILILVVWLIPLVPILLAPDFAINIGFLYVMWAFSGPAYVTAKIVHHKIFSRFEKE